MDWLDEPIEADDTEEIEPGVKDDDRWLASEDQEDERSECEGCGES